MFHQSRYKCLGELAIGNERDVHIHRFAADDEAVFACVGELMCRDIDDEVEFTVFQQFHYIWILTTAYFVHLLAFDVVLTQEIRSVFGRKKFETHCIQLVN